VAGFLVLHILCIKLFSVSDYMNFDTHCIWQMYIKIMTILINAPASAIFLLGLSVTRLFMRSLLFHSLFNTTSAQIIPKHYFSVS
jgi:hypothetical protein